MRFITTSPKNVIPDLVESDIDRNLIIAHIYRRYNNSIINVDKIICAVKYYSPEKTLNWYGGNVYSTGCLWCHEYNGSLINFLIKSWEHWIDVLKMYICESLEDVEFACNEIGVTNKYLRNDIYGQFKLIEDIRAGLLL